MKLVEVEEKYFQAWGQMRRTHFSDLNDEFNEREMRSIFDSQERACFIILANSNEVMGFLEVALRNLVDGCLGSPVGYIEGLYLKPQYRGFGYGRQVVESIAEWFGDRNCKEMATDTELDNINAQKFYESIGFQETYRIVEFKKNIL